MRLLFVSHSFPPDGRPLSNVGGMQRVATELHAALRVREDVRLKTLALRCSWRWTHIRVVPFMVKVLARLGVHIRRRDLDVVLFSSMVTAALAIPFRARLKRAGIRTATIVHGRDVTLPVAIYQRLVPHIFRAQDFVLPISRAVRQECIERGATDKQLRLIPNGINLARYARNGSALPPRLRLEQLIGQELPSEALMLCSVGRQVPRKGFSWFIEHVLPRLPEHVHYVLVGEGPEADTISARVRQLGLSARVHLLGRIDEDHLTTVYQGSDLFVMPNIPVPGDMEGFGVVMLEAGVNGLPTIAAGIEGIRDVITEGANGHLLEPLNAGAFVQRILAFDEDRSALATASRRAVRHVRNTYDWNAVAARYEDALRLLVPDAASGDGASVLPAHTQITVPVSEQAIA